VAGGDPFTEKLLLEPASSLATGGVVGNPGHWRRRARVLHLRDARAQRTGMNVELAAVPQREAT